jgi:hypothetical protein
MNKTIAKYVVASEKQNVEFENRIAAIFAAGQSGEEALETLILGVPISFEVLDKEQLMGAISSSCCKIKDVRLSSRLQLEVSYERTVERWFKTQEAADKATYYGDGYSRQTEDYTIRKVLIDENNTTTLNLATLEENGVIKVYRK